MPGATFHLVPYAIPFVAPFATAGGTHTRREGILFRLAHGSGPAGWGEAAPLPDHGGETLARAAEALLEIALHLASAAEEGQGPPATLDELGRLCTELRARWPDAPAARSAVDCALADAAARRAGVPLARWLHPSARPVVWVNAVIGAVTPARAARQAAAAAAEGYPAIKVKLGTDDVADLQRIAAVRRAVGGAMLLRADANGAWTRTRAEVMLDALTAHRVEYVEQPVAADDVEALAYLRRHAGTAVAADEALLVPGGPERVLAREAADVLVLKPALLGGLAAAWSLAEDAAARGMSAVVTTSLDTAVGRAAALHLAAALPGAEVPCGLATGDLLAHDVAVGPGIDRGRIHVPLSPGLGIALDAAILGAINA